MRHVFVRFCFSLFFILQISSVSNAQSLASEIDLELQDQFYTLTEKEQSQFLEKRKNILKGLETTLNKTRLLFHVMDIIKAGAVGIKDFVLYDTLNHGLSDEIKEMIRQDQENHPEKYRDLNRSERVTEKIRSILRATDAKLWAQSPIVANANQFSFLFAAAVQAEGGTQTKKWGGLYDLGFTIGYNTDTKAVVLQIFRNRETFESTIMPALAVGGVVVKAGPHISRLNLDSSLQMSGQSFYPPLVPGYQSTTKESFAFGFSSGLTWPPSPFGDMLTYTNRLDHKVILKISFSKTFMGFVRVQTNLKSKTLQLMQKKFAELFNPRPMANSCHALF